MSDLNRTLTHLVETKTSFNTVMVMLMDTDISDAAMAQIANRLRGAPVIDFMTANEDPELEEEATPAPRKEAHQECFCCRKQEDHAKNGGGGSLVRTAPEDTFVNRYYFPDNRNSKFKDTDMK